MSGGGSCERLFQRILAALSVEEVVSGGSCVECDDHLGFCGRLEEAIGEFFFDNLWRMNRREQEGQHADGATFYQKVLHLAESVHHLKEVISESSCDDHGHQEVLAAVSRRSCKDRFLRFYENFRTKIVLFVGLQNDFPNAQ